MKKLAYLSALVLGFGLTACDAMQEPNPPAQSNPQAPVVSIDDITVMGDLTAETTLDLEALNNTNSVIPVAQIECESLADGYHFASTVEISNNGFEKAYVVESSVVDAEVPFTWNVVVTPDALQGVYQNNISLRPDAAEVEFRVNLMIEKDSEGAYVGGPDFFFGPWSATVLPMSNGFEIENGYYLVGSFTDPSWTVSAGLAFSHSSKDVYDDPVFTLAVTITEEQAEEGWWWKIVPASVYDTGDWGSGAFSQFGVAENGSEDLSGALKAASDDAEPGSGCIKVAGDLILTINMLELTYEFSEAPTFLWVPGDAQGWAPDTAMQLYKNADGIYEGYAVLGTGGFKFTSQPDWDGINYGVSDEEGALDTDGAAGNLTVEETGLYWCQVDDENLTYEVTLISTYGIIGDATEGAWDASTPLTQSEDFVTFTGEVTLTDGSFKFRANDGWDINLGGNDSVEPSDNYEDLVQNGKNLASPGAGTYTVTLDLSVLPYSTTLVKK